MNSFENNSKKQRKLFNLIDKSFLFIDLTFLEEAIRFYNKSTLDQLLKKENDHLFLVESSEEEIKHNNNLKHIKDKNKTYIDNIYKKLYYLYVIDFSIEWEKFIREILIIANVDLPKNKVNSYGQIIEKNIKIYFPNLYNHKVYKKIIILRQIANEIKHSNNQKNYFLNKNNLQKLLEIQVDLFESEHGYIRNFLNSNNIDEKSKEYFENEVKKLDAIKEKTLKNKRLSISYIIKCMRLQINDWFYSEFSFNKKRVIEVTFENITRLFIVFSDLEENKIRNNPEKYFND
ncbi:MAG: hypothetical protein ACRCRZ_02980 [Metamycoplasmataceae bacterium]